MMKFKGISKYESLIEYLSAILHISESEIRDKLMDNDIFSWENFKDEVIKNSKMCPLK